MSLGGCRKQAAWELRWCCAVDCSRVGRRQPGRHGRPWSPAALIGQSAELTTTSADTGDWCRRHDVCRQLNNLAPDRGDTRKWGRRVWSRHALETAASEALAEEVWRAGTDLSGRWVWRWRWALTVVGGVGAPGVRRAWRYRSVDAAWWATQPAMPERWMLWIWLRVTKQPDTVRDTCECMLTSLSIVIPRSRTADDG